LIRQFETLEASDKSYLGTGYLGAIQRVRTVKNEKLKTALQGVNIGLSFGVGLGIRLLIFCYGGAWIDEKLGTKPWFAFAGLLLAIFLSFYYLFTELIGQKTGGDSGESSEGDQDDA